MTTRMIATEGFYGERRGRRVHVRQGALLAAAHPLVRAHPEKFAPGETREQIADARARFPATAAPAPSAEASGPVGEDPDESDTE